MKLHSVQLDNIWYHTTLDTDFWYLFGIFKESAPKISSIMHLLGLQRLFCYRIRTIVRV